MKIGKPKKVQELNEEQLDLMKRGALDAHTINTPDGFEIGFDTVLCNPQLITDEGLGEIMQIHWQTPTRKIEDTDTPRSVFSKQNASYKINHVPGHDITVLKEPDLTHVIDIVGATLPDMHDFGKVSFACIHHLTSGTYLPWACENGDEMDTATCFITLNDMFSGGRFIIDPGMTYDLPRGSFLGFNNCNQILYTMEPIYDGERFLLQIFFQRPTVEEANKLINQ